MPTNYGVFGQTADASTEVTLYTVPVSANIKFKVTVSNRAGTSANYRIAIVPDGGATANEHYVAYDKSIAGNESVTSTTFIANADDVIRVESSSATVSFSIYGIEQS